LIDKGLQLFYLFYLRATVIFSNSIYLQILFVRLYSVNFVFMYAPKKKKL